MRTKLRVTNCLLASYWREFYDTQIEHVLPQHWEDHWKDTIDNYDKSLRNKDFLNGTDFDANKAHRLLINSLGDNLTILRGGKNAHVSNDSWVDKQKKHIKELRLVKWILQKSVTIHGIRLTGINGLKKIF